MKLITLICLLIPGCLIGQGHLQIEGSYQGYDLYLQNPKSDDGDSYCVDSVLVNGAKVDCDVATSSFVVEFDTLKFYLGEKVVIDIYHHDDCTPKVIHTNHHLKSTFRVEEISIDTNAKISASFSGKEMNSVCIEQYRWNKWIKISDVYFITPPLDTAFDVSQSVHSGMNKFRISSKDIIGRKKPSETVVYNAHLPKEEYQIDYENETVIFNQATMYQVYDGYGNLLIQGDGSTIDISQLDRGAYYLNYGNTNEKFRTRRIKK